MGSRLLPVSQGNASGGQCSLWWGRHFSARELCLRKPSILLWGQMSLRCLART